MGMNQMGCRFVTTFEKLLTEFDAKDKKIFCV